MTRKILYILAVLFCANTLLSTMSCMDCGGCLGEKATYCVRADSFQLLAYQVGGGRLDTGNEVHATSLRLEVLITTSSAICYRPKTKQNLSLFSTAYACKPPRCESYLSTDSIISYDVYSDKGYDAGHPAGASLKDVFSTVNGYQSLKMYNEQDVEFRLLCKTAPGDTGTHVLTVMFLEKDGDTVRLNTPPLKLLK